MTLKLRSSAWFETHDEVGFLHRAALRSEGFTREAFAGRPVIGICNSWSELNNCNVHLRAVADAVKRGVWAAGGFPLEFMTISLGEELMMPTAMLYRNLMAMDVEEMIRSNPLDGVVLLCGCDKTTPAQLMGAASMDVPAIMLSSRSRRPAERERLARPRRVLLPQRRTLQHHGHGLDYDRPGRGARHDAA